jgi:hypothetical protein
VAIRAPGHRRQQVGGRFAFGNGALYAFIEHDDNAADDLEVAQFLGRDVEQQVLPAGIAFGKSLSE